MLDTEGVFLANMLGTCSLLILLFLMPDRDVMRYSEHWMLGRDWSRTLDVTYDSLGAMI